MLHRRISGRGGTGLLRCLRVRMLQLFAHFESGTVSIGMWEEIPFRLRRFHADQMMLDIDDINNTSENAKKHSNQTGSGFY